MTWFDVRTFITRNLPIPHSLVRLMRVWKEICFRMEREKVLGLISGIMDNYFTKATTRTASERVFGSPLIEK